MALLLDERGSDRLLNEQETSESRVYLSESYRPSLSASVGVILSMRNGGDGAVTRRYS